MDVDFNSSEVPTFQTTGPASPGFAPYGQSTPPVGFIVPGGPVRTDFVSIDGTGSKFALTLTAPNDLPVPINSVHEVVCFLAAPTPAAITLPLNHGMLLYWQVTEKTTQQQSGFELLGAITPDRPSVVLRTGWSEHEQFLALPQGGATATVTIGLSIEPLDSIQNLLQGHPNAPPTSNGNGIVGSPMSATTSSSGTARQPSGMAQKIGQDLFNFMQSFDTSDRHPDLVRQKLMLVPANIFERWWKRFEAKSARDPTFFLKESI